MRKVILNLAVSMDGFIARENGRVDWLDNLDTSGSDLGFGKFLSDLDTLFTGRRSFEETVKLGNGSWPFKDMDTYVFTRNTFENTGKCTFTNENPKDILASIRLKEGKNIWLFGGGGFIKSMREENLIDEYIITRIPIMLGKGIALFQDVDRESNLELLSVEKVNNILQTHYKVVK